jgi:hypothetical protein
MCLMMHSNSELLESKTADTYFALACTAINLLALLHSSALTLSVSVWPSVERRVHLHNCGRNIAVKADSAAWLTLIGGLQQALLG